MPGNKEKKLLISRKEAFRIAQKADDRSDERKPEETSEQLETQAKERALHQEHAQIAIRLLEKTLQPLLNEANQAGFNNRLEYKIEAYIGYYTQEKPIAILEESIRLGLGIETFNSLKCVGLYVQGVGVSFVPVIRKNDSLPQKDKPYIWWASESHILDTREFWGKEFTRLFSLAHCQEYLREIFNKRLVSHAEFKIELAERRKKLVSP